MILQRLSLKYKSSLTLGLLVLFFIGTYTLIQYYRQKSDLQASSSQYMAEKVDKLSQTINLEIKDRQQTVNTAINLAHSIFYNKGRLVEEQKPDIEMTAVNQLNKASHTVRLKSWQIGDLPLHNNFFLVDTIKQLSVETATIFQKIDSGYLRISTNVKKLDGSRAVGTFIPNNSSVIQTIEQGKTYRGRAYVVNAWYLTAYEPIYINGDIKGILYVGIKEKNFYDIENLFIDGKFESAKLYLAELREGELTVLGEDAESNFVQMLKEELQDTSKQSGDFKYTDAEGNTISLFYTFNETVQSYIVFTVNDSELYASLSGLILANSIAGLVIAVLIIIFLIIYVSKRIFDPLDRIRQAMQRISQKDINFRIDSKRQDEIGELNAAINAINENFQEIINNISETAISVLNAGSQLNTIAQSVSQSAGEQAATTEEISSSMEQMVANINQNTDNAQQTLRTSQLVTNDITNIKQSFEETISAMKDIADKITIVNDIAEKTDLLAINAAIEAARAGEYGKGFSVVAAEIRALAIKSQEAAVFIDELSNKSFTIAEETGLILDKAIPNIRKTIQLINEIAAASVEQNAGANQINSSVQQLVDVTNENSSSAEEMSTGASELEQQAERLTHTVNEFNISETKATAHLGHLKQQLNVLLQEIESIENANSTNKTNKKQPALKNTEESNTQNTKGISIDMEQDDDSDFEHYE